MLWLHWKALSEGGFNRASLLGWRGRFQKVLSHRRMGEIRWEVGIDVSATLAKIRKFKSRYLECFAAH